MKSRKRCVGYVKENVRRTEREAPLLERRKKPRYFRPPGAATLWLDKSTTRAVEIGIIPLSVLPSLSLPCSLRLSVLHESEGAIDEGVISPSFLFIVITFLFSCAYPTTIFFLAFLYLANCIRHVVMWSLCKKSICNAPKNSTKISFRAFDFIGKVIFYERQISVCRLTFRESEQGIYRCGSIAA